MKLAPSIQYLHKFYKNVTGHKHNFSFNAYRVISGNIYNNNDPS